MMQKFGNYKKDVQLLYAHRFVQNDKKFVKFKFLGLDGTSEDLTAAGDDLVPECKSRLIRRGLELETARAMRAVLQRWLKRDRGTFAVCKSERMAMSDFGFDSLRS